MSNQWTDPTPPPPESKEVRNATYLAFAACLVIVAMFIGAGIYAARDDDAAPATTAAVTTSTSLVTHLDDTTIQIMSIDVGIASDDGSVCGNPAMDAFTDEQIVLLFEEGFGEKLTPAAAEYLVNRVRSC